MISRRSSLSKILAGLVLTGLLFFPLTGCKEEKEKAPVQTDIPTVLVTDVLQKTVPIYSEYVAVVDPTTGSSTIEIRARVPAFLIEQCFREGKPVSKGQVLFRLDPRTYQAALQSAVAARDKAQADLDYAKQSVSVKRAEADVETAKSQLALAKLNEARLKPLAEQKAVPQQDYDNAKTALEVAKADLAAKQAMYQNTVLDQVNSIKMAKAEVLSAQASIDAAKVNLGYCTVVSPIDGIAGKRLVAPGNLVGQGDPTLLTTVTNLDNLRVNFNVSENDYLLLMEDKIKLKAKTILLPKLYLILSDGSTYLHKGKIAITQPVLDPKTGTLQLIGEFPNPEHLLRPGMFGRIRLQVDEVDNAVLIPQIAVTELQSANVAYVVDKDNKVELRTLSLGDPVGNDIIILSGLKVGEKVITEGLLKVRPGMTVKPVYQSATQEGSASAKIVRKPLDNSPEAQALKKRAGQESKAESGSKDPSIREAVRETMPPGTSRTPAKSSAEPDKDSGAALPWAGGKSK